MANEYDPFALNIRGVQDLVSNPVNKVSSSGVGEDEGVTGDKYEAFEVKMTDEELLKLRDEFEKKYSPYEGKLKPRVEKIRESYVGKRKDGQWLVDNDIPIAANLQFEAMETFLSYALAKNPQPVTWCDNTPEGTAIADAVKTMLQFHSDQLVIRRKLAIMVRQWAMNLLGGLKPGWNDRINDVAIDNTKIQDYVFDPDGYVDAYGDFSSWFGERKKVNAEKLIEMFPEHETKIKVLVDNKMGTECTYTEWWPSDDYCFYTFKDIVLDKHKNHLFKYPEPINGLDGKPALDPNTGEPLMTKVHNHFAHPKKPGIFLSVYSLQEQPHDITSNIEQNIPNQNRIMRRTEQIDYNASASNNSYAFSEDNFNQETAKQAANARKKGNPILVPSGGPMDRAIMPLHGQDLPTFIYTELETAKSDLRSSWGIQGITPQDKEEDRTARGMILRQAQDTSRIGGGIGQSLEQVADNVFNWLVQLYCVFYDQNHFAAIMGEAKAVEYVQFSAMDIDRQLIVSIAADSMMPKDDISEANLAQSLFDKGAIGPVTLLKMLSFPDPDEAASDGVFYKVDPVSYMKVHWPQLVQQIQQAQMQAAAVAPGGAPAPAPGGATPEVPQAPTQNLSGEPASSQLSQVPLSTPAA